MNICIIGSGKMGSIIANGLIGSGFTGADQIIATDHSEEKLESIRLQTGVNTTLDNTLAVSTANMILLCIKPQNAEIVSKEIAPFIKKDAVIVSIMAGVTLAKLESWFANHIVVRAMPNTPTTVNEGMTVFAGGKLATADNISWVESAFSGIGKTMVLEEKHFDAVTGLSASGPAFIYIVIEALADGGVKCGLPRDVAIRLAAQMTLGSAKMVLDTGRHPALLKDDVTTPAGCTTDGILALEEGGVRVTLIKAVTEATRRAAELG